jgi:hypothetical protein
VQVLTDSSVAKRSMTTGHLLLTCPKLCPVVVSKAPQTRKKTSSNALKGVSATPMLQAPPVAPGSDLKGAVDIKSIVPHADTLKPAPAEMVQALGPDYDDEDDVPPLL